MKRDEAIRSNFRSGIPTKSKVDPEISRLGRKAFKSMVDIPIG
jgi:hypothetical protein